MKTVVLAIAAAAGLALTAGTASAHPPRYYGSGYYGGGYYAPRPVVVQPYYAMPVYRPVYPSYGYGYGYGYAPFRPGFSITIGGGFGGFGGYGYPSYGGGYYRGW